MSQNLYDLHLNSIVTDEKPTQHLLWQEWSPVTQ